MPQYEELPQTKNSWVLALDQVRDPGNLGAIVRIADWYGISDIVCSTQSVDFFNPKVIAATMGSFIRVKVYYTDLPQWLSTNKVMVFGAVLNGLNVHQTQFKKYQGGIIVLGSESHGISSEVLPHITQKITIPRFGGAESLNVAMATAIILDNWKQH
jgi:TrmH family RNA methyltransferase